MFDQLLGVGREPRARNNTVIIDTGVLSTTFPSGAGDEVTQITTTPIRLVAAQISMVQTTTNTGGTTDAQFSVKINDQPIATYNLPGAPAWGYQIQDTVPLSAELWGSGNSLTLNTASGAAANSYNVSYRVKLIGYAI